jgi:CDP-glycerol glycerophosphotransferase
MRIVYNSFSGRYSDSPRALYERLADTSGIEHLWLRDAAHASAFPSDVATVDVNSPAEAATALESADLVVASSHTEVEWRKTPGTLYLQTWHGTPMKRIHHDVLWAPPGRLSRLDRDVAKWDLLLSPNAVSTPRLRAAFRYDGEVLESGYPRNDALGGSLLPSTRREARARLGLSETETVVLYAPTWRDDEYFAEAATSVPLHLDLGQLGALLGANHTILVRTHYLMTGRVPVQEDHRVRDVSYYPDIRELHAAADVLVTDYSSAMFDFAVTGKPIVFFTYDMDRFRDSIRGFYFDLQPVAPGPLTEDPRMLAEALRDLPGLQRAYADRYRAFRDVFCHLEDGRATARVLDHLGISVDRRGAMRPAGAVPTASGPR